MMYPYMILADETEIVHSQISLMRMEMLQMRMKSLECIQLKSRWIC